MGLDGRFERRPALLTAGFRWCRPKGCEKGKLPNAEQRPEAGEMAQWVKAFAAKPSDPSLIPRTHMV